MTGEETDLSPDGFWAAMQRPGPQEVTVDGVPVRAGSRVRLRPRSHADIVDLALDGRAAVVERVEQDEAGRFQLAVTLEDDPGRDLGDARMPGHRFFYPPEDVVPLAPAAGVPPPPRVLVAGIGNVFLGDDGFGVEVVRQLAAAPATPGVDVVEFGIRGMDLVYALHRGYRAAVLVDAARRGQPPGTLAVVEPERAFGGPVAVQPHGMDPVRVLRLARELGPLPERLLVVCCEPASVPDPAGDVVQMGLSPVVRDAVAPAVALVTGTVAELVAAAKEAEGYVAKGGESG